MFNGFYEHSLDDKGRVVLPLKIRYSLGEKFIITKGLHGCLTIFTEPEWAKFSQFLAEQDVTNLDAARVQRFYAAYAFEVTTDSQNRMAIPAVLRKYAGIEDQVIITGASNRVEIWNPERWEAATADVEADDIAESVKALKSTGASNAPAAS